MTEATPTTHTTDASRVITVVWAVLAVITVATWWLAPGHTDSVATVSTPLTIAALALAFVKGRLIVRYFMDVRNAPRWLQFATDAWLAVVTLGVLVIYLYQ